MFSLGLRGKMEDILKDKSKVGGIKSALSESRKGERVRREYKRR